MKYKILLAGKNDSVIDEFFENMTESFETVSTSAHMADILNHLSFFKPDVFVYCMSGENADDMSRIANMRFRMTRAGIAFVTVGFKEDCDEFDRITPGEADLTLHMPLPVYVIQDKIMELVKNSRFRHAVDEISLENAEKEGAPAQAAAAQAGYGPRKHILVVDDDAMMLKTIKEHLHDRYEVATASSGQTALKFLERKKTDLILLDYEMPDAKGPAILARLRSSEMTRKIPVIFLTSVTDTNKIMEALALKPQNYLLKPVDPVKLLDTIAKTIG